MDPTEQSEMEKHYEKERQYEDWDFILRWHPDDKVKLSLVQQIVETDILPEDGTSDYGLWFTSSLLADDNIPSHIRDALFDSALKLSTEAPEHHWAVEMLAKETRVPPHMRLKAAISIFEMNGDASHLQYLKEYNFELPEEVQKQVNEVWEKVKLIELDGLRENGDYKRLYSWAYDHTTNHQLLSEEARQAAEKLLPTAALRALERIKDGSGYDEETQLATRYNEVKEMLEFRPEFPIKYVLPEHVLAAASKLLETIGMKLAIENLRQDNYDFCETMAVTEVLPKPVKDFLKQELAKHAHHIAMDLGVDEEMRKKHKEMAKKKKPPRTKKARARQGRSS